jgi:hypothetical protein
MAGRGARVRGHSSLSAGVILHVLYILLGSIHNGGECMDIAFICALTRPLLLHFIVGTRYRAFLTYLHPHSIMHCLERHHSITHNTETNKNLIVHARTPCSIFLGNPFACMQQTHVRMQNNRGGKNRTRSTNSATHAYDPSPLPIIQNPLARWSIITHAKYDFHKTPSRSSSCSGVKYCRRGG